MTSSRSDAHVATPVRFVSTGFLASMVRPLVAYVIAPRCAHIDGVPTMCCLAMSDVVWGSSDVASPAFYIVCCLSAFIDHMIYLLAIRPCEGRNTALGGALLPPRPSASGR